MRVEVRNYTDGGVEAIVLRDDGEPIAQMRVRPTALHGPDAEHYEVESSVRDVLDEEPSLGRRYTGRRETAFVPRQATAAKSSSGQAKPIAR